jgi:hypothetical protein
MTGLKLDLPASEQANEDYNDGNDQEDVNESSHGIGGNKSQQPEDNQDDGDGF